LQLKQAKLETTVEEISQMKSAIAAAEQEEREHAAVLQKFDQLKNVSDAE